LSGERIEGERRERPFVIKKPVKKSSVSFNGFSELTVEEKKKKSRLCCCKLR